MGSDQNNNSGCLFPFGDDFLPIFMFFSTLIKPTPARLNLTKTMRTMTKNLLFRMQLQA